MANKNDNSSAGQQLRELTERAQREPGVSQVLSLLEHARAAEQTIRELVPDPEHFVGGTFSHTF